MTSRQDYATATPSAPGTAGATTGSGRTARAQQGSGPGGSGSASAGDRLPRAPRRRRPALAALAVLLIVGGGTVAGLLAVRLDDRATVLVAAREIPPGQQITRDDLAVAKVSSDGVAVIAASQAGQVVGRYAAQDIPAGRLLDAGMLNASGLLRDGFAAVGVALKPGRYPAGGLQAGDVVEVVRVVDGAASLLVDRGTISSVHQPSSGAFGGGSGDVTVTVVLTRRAAAAVAAAAAADQVALVLLTRGAPAAG